MWWSFPKTKQLHRQVHQFWALTYKNPTADLTLILNKCLAGRTRNGNIVCFRGMGEKWHRKYYSKKNTESVGGTRFFRAAVTRRKQETPKLKSAHPSHAICFVTHFEMSSSIIECSTLIQTGVQAFFFAVSPSVTEDPFAHLLAQYWSDTLRTE